MKLLFKLLVFCIISTGCNREKVATFEDELRNSLKVVNWQGEGQNAYAIFVSRGDFVLTNNEIPGNNARGYILYPGKILVSSNEEVVKILRDEVSIKSGKAKLK